jgi:ribonuclease T1
MTYRLLPNRLFTYGLSNIWFKQLLKQCATAIVGACIFFSLFSLANAKGNPSDLGTAPQISVADLPKEAVQTLELIRKGGPFPNEKDGVVFGNREKQLPKQARGYYTEYTVKTPGAKNRGARRLVVGGPPQSSKEIYYTDDHYESFKRVKQVDQ